ncbi:peroxiredoxin [Catenovulum agarivorans DS-2]|uniref:Glutathione peroxidase n=1 Tax=Catenovulum agarivorans DS-2 TaxID=1328313 RepID=W7QA68_9ALTE|nr:glutathione peroxidase [Catenovulum agarivorans]EWH08901.1 peroxiredoxin [Catenovulum agarivorans DS-2]
MSNIYQFCVEKANGHQISLNQFRGKWLLVVNTASHCGFTPQYEGLEKLQQEYANCLQVLAFPCNQFGEQEPGRNEEIQSFCSLMYKVSFPVLAKIDVNGESAHPLFKYLKKQKKGLLGSESIKWNFTKFLISPEGEVVRRYGSTTTPEKITNEFAHYAQQNCPV